MWKTVKLGDVCKIVNGGTPKSNVKEHWEGDIQWLTPKDMGKIDGKYVDLTERQITKDGLNNSSAKLIPANSVILSCRAPIGHVFINTIEMSFNQGCKGLVPTEDIRTDYLYYFLFASKQLLNDLGTGTTFKEISGKTLANVELLLPPLAEQQRIVAKLDAAFAEIDRVVHSENVNIELLERLKESNLLAQFSKLDSKCNFFRLDEVCKDFSRGKSKHRPRNDEKLYGDTIPFVQTGDVSNSTKYLNSYTKSYSDFGLLQSKKWRKGTVCITIAANIAELAILEIDACFPDSVIGALPNDDITTSEYLYYLLNFFQKKIKAKSKGSAQQNINLATFNDEKFPFPSLSVQKFIASEIAKSEASVEKIKQLKFQKIDLLNSLKSAILARELNPSEAA